MHIDASVGRSIGRDQSYRGHVRTDQANLSQSIDRSAPRWVKISGLAYAYAAGRNRTTIWQAKRAARPPVRPLFFRSIIQPVSVCFYPSNPNGIRRRLCHFLSAWRRLTEGHKNRLMDSKTAL